MIVLILVILGNAFVYIIVLKTKNEDCHQLSHNELSPGGLHRPCSRPATNPYVMHGHFRKPGFPAAYVMLICYPWKPRHVLPQ